MVNLRRVRPDRLAFVLSCGLLLFGYGVAVGKYGLFPHDALEFTIDSVEQVMAERGTLLGTRPTEFLEPVRYAGTGVTVNTHDASVAPLTLLTGLFEGDNQVRLIRADGTVIRKWPVRFFDFFPDPVHIAPAANRPASNWNAAVHGAHLLPDGSVVMNFTYKGTVKLDRCGRTQWVLPRMTHHSVEPSIDGSLWIPSARYIEDRTRFPFLAPPYVEDTLLRISPAGEVLTEISVPEIMFRNNLQGLLFWRNATGDMTHVNDVEELQPQMAAAFPMFAPGDLLVSMRKQHVVFVVDPATLTVKWYQAGPWLGQHDPDFTTSGTILVFNNNEDGTPAGSRFGGASIVEIEPATRKVTFRYGGQPQQRMYTHERGKLQQFDGKLLVTEASAGRAFEVDARGTIVWEFINRYDEQNAALITEATRYPADYFTVKDWSCGR